MSETTTLADVLKSAPAATEISGLSMLCVNSSGELRKPDARSLLVPLYTTRTDVVNMDELLTPGIYSTGGATLKSTLPAESGWNGCLVEVFSRGSYTFQRITNNSCSMAIRVRISSGWSAWKIFTGTT
ncbi:MAG: pyocin knob domain-containing protein [Muribaculaceae bacterium]|nr:pyocin knob domain-containing protein [Muribaculaceae bacterium]